MPKKSIKDKATAQATRMAISMLEKDPDKNIPKLVSWWEKFDKSPEHDRQKAVVREIVDHPDNNWYRLIRSLFDDIDGDVLKKIFENFVVNSYIIGTDMQRKMSAKYDCNVPWEIGRAHV